MVQDVSPGPCLCCLRQQNNRRDLSLWNLIGFHYNQVYARAKRNLLAWKPRLSIEILRLASGPNPAAHHQCTQTPMHIFRYINTTLWAKAGHFNKALSKGAKTTTWIWNLHDYAHDFDIQQRSTGLIARKVFSSNLAHLSLVLFG